MLGKPLVRRLGSCTAVADLTVLRQHPAVLCIGHPL
jgi:hypothetical protein